MRLGLSLAASVHYDVLRHLDLGADAASIHAGATAPWSAALEAEYPTGGRADRVQVLPLITPDLSALLAVLREGGGFERMLAQVVGEHARSFEPTWRAAQAAYERRADAAAERLFGPLTAARTALWRRIERTPPELLVLDARPLGRYARGATIGDRQVVACAFDRSDEDLFCAILHEETHAVTDPEVLRRHHRPRDTRRTAEGYAVHRALELAALELADAVVRESVTELATHHARWVERLRP